MTALQPFRLANARFISSSNPKPAQPHAAAGKPGIVKGNPSPPPPMSVVQDQTQTQVPLPSQEGTKGVVQYALYVSTTTTPHTATKKTDNDIAQP